MTANNNNNNEQFDVWIDETPDKQVLLNPIDRTKIRSKPGSKALAGKLNNGTTNCFIEDINNKVFYIL